MLTTTVLPLQIEALTYNARLWGQTVFVQGRPTSVYCQDDLRSRMMQDGFQRLTQTGRRPDLIGFTEFWDEKLMHAFRDSDLWGDYECVPGPFGGGFSEIFPIMREKSPFLHYVISRNPDVIVKYFARSQLLEGGTGVHPGPFDRHVLGPIKSTLVRMMEDRTFLGSGLVLFSRFKVVASEFVPFTSKKFGLDNYARKGALCATVEPAPGRRLCIILTHLHVGKSKEESEARREQIRQLRPLVREAAYPVVFMGDLNIVAEEFDAGSEKLAMTDEYRWTMDQLGLADSFRDAFPDPNALPESWGYTYDDTTHFSEALGIQSRPQSRRHLQRLDFILRDARLRTLSSEVLRAGMRHAAYGSRDLSDHFPLRSALSLYGDVI